MFKKKYKKFQSIVFLSLCDITLLILLITSGSSLRYARHYESEKIYNAHYFVILKSDQLIVMFKDKEILNRTIGKRISADILKRFDESIPESVIVDLDIDTSVCFGQAWDIQYILTKKQIISEYLLRKINETR